ncbi:MAG TPA: acyl-CoA dehydrogenase family protein [Xanthobacteraceae bacterium]|nr:acyl-CoA dehydrogenase family protein [Xanthobacteraceae bacterium]
MPPSPSPAQNVTAQQIVERARALAPRFAERAQAAEEARRIPPESVKDMLDAGFARILLPREIGGYGLGFDTWYEVTRELSKTDASHGWCAGLIIHHAHLIAQYPQAGQKSVWAEGLDMPIAASFAPAAKAVPADGGYRVSSAGSPFASGVDHCPWVMLGGMTQGGTEPEWKFFLVPPGEYAIRDTWFTAGMRGTGSKTIVVDDAFVPESRVMTLADLRAGTAPGGAHYNGIIFHTPFFYYAPISFASPMLGAAQGAYEMFREWIKTRKTPDGTSLADKTSVQVRMARVAADIDAAELLLRRAVQVTDAPDAYSPQLLARSVRDYARISELMIGVIDTLVALSGTAGFASSHPLQRAWRDIHFMSMHISLNTETNFAHYGRMQLGLGPEPTGRYF